MVHRKGLETIGKHSLQVEILTTLQDTYTDLYSECRYTFLNI